MRKIQAKKQEWLQELYELNDLYFAYHRFSNAEQSYEKYLLLSKMRELIEQFPRIERIKLMNRFIHSKSSSA